MLAQYERRLKDWNEHFTEKEEQKLLEDAKQSQVFKEAIDYTKDNSKILEGGCSRGRYLEALRVEGYDMYGFELDKEMVKVCQDKKLKVKEGSILNIPYPDKFCDTYLEIGLIEHLTPEEQDKALEEIKRVLRHEGILIINFAFINKLRDELIPYFKLKTLIQKHLKYKFYQWWYSERDMEALLEKHGFEIIDFKQHCESRAIIVAEKGE